jgi:hypothetical protein
MPGRLVVLASLIAALGCASAAAAAGPAAQLPAGWSHAAINVIGPRGKAHTLIYDRGRVQLVGASSLTLNERDGYVVTIQVAPDAVVRIDGRLASLAQIVPGYQARTLGVDGKPAKQVLATRPPRFRRLGAGSGSTGSAGGAAG